MTRIYIFSLVSSAVLLFSTANATTPHYSDLILDSAGVQVEYEARCPAGYGEYGHLCCNAFSPGAGTPNPEKKVCLVKNLEDYIVNEPAFYTCCRIETEKNKK